MLLRNIFFWLILVGVHTCQKEQEGYFKYQKNNNLIKIQIKEDVKDSNLSKVFDFENSIVLDTAAIIGTISKIISFKDQFYIGDFKNTKTVYCYSDSGTLQWQCNPRFFQEEAGILDFSVSSADGTLHILCSKAVYFFDADGNFLQKLVLKSPAGKLISQDHGALLLYNYTSTGSKFQQWSPKGKLIAEGLSAASFCSHPVAGISDLNKAAYLNKAVYCQFLNDTVFNIKNLEITPEYLVDFGGRAVKETQKALFEQMTYPEVMETLNHSGMATGLDMVYETENVVHFSFLYKNRYTSVYFDKRSQNVAQIGPDSDDLFLESFGYIPFGVLPNDRFVFVLEPQSLHTTNEIKGKKTQVKHPLVNELIKKTNGLSNPILLIGKFKRQNHE